MKKSIIPGYVQHSSNHGAFICLPTTESVIAENHSITIEKQSNEIESLKDSLGKLLVEVDHLRSLVESSSTEGE